MSKLAADIVTSQPTSSGPREPILSSSRWVAVIAVAAFGFLVVTRRAFREFIPS